MAKTSKIKTLCKSWKVRYSLYFIWSLIILLFFNIYLREILIFNAKLRNFIVNKNFTIREINENGIPISYSSRIGKFISPFYVVNYGIYYSEILIGKGIINRKNDFCWESIGSLKLWYFSVNEQSISIKMFKNTADWIINNVSPVHNSYHLVYKFDWPYPNYKYNIIKSPWWSGLADSYALILLIRAYDIFEEDKYLKTAKVLYRNTLKDIKNGGSLTYLGNYPWIEEYVDYLHPDETPRVLNGMMHAYIGIKCFEERYVNSKKQIGKLLLESIINNLNKFDMGLWSYYDYIGNPANVKYHKINTYLLKELQKEIDNPEKRETFNKIIYRWNIGSELPILWLFYSQMSISKIHVLMELIFLLLFPILLCKTRIFT